MALALSTLAKPVNNQIIDPSTGVMRQEWIEYFGKLTGHLNGAVRADNAPVDAAYIVGATSSALTAERVATNSASNTWNLSVAGQALVERAALTGDVTASANSNATTIADDAVSNAKLANMAQGLIKGRATGAGTGDPTDLTSAQATAILDAFTSALKGLAPASGGGTANFLRADGSWAVPPGVQTWTSVFKATDESTNTDTTYTDDAALKFAMLASTTYAIRGMIFYDTPAAADFKYQFNGPASPTLVRVGSFCVGPGGSGFNGPFTNEAYATSNAATGGATFGWAEFAGMVRNGVNPGTFAVQWAQNTSNASNTTVLAGSFIEYRAM